MEVMRLWGLVPDSIGGVETVFGLVRADFWVCTMLCVTLRAPHQEESRIVRRDSAIFPWVDAVLAVRICPPPSVLYGVANLLESALSVRDMGLLAWWCVGDTRFHSVRD